jgi:hypothetical protein
MIGAQRGAGHHELLHDIQTADVLFQSATCLSFGMVGGDHPLIGQLDARHDECPLLISYPIFEFAERAHRSIVDAVGLIVADLGGEVIFKWGVVPDHSRVPSLDFEFVLMPRGPC